MEEEIPRDSFDRYGDDLSNLILSYLPQEDMLRFESVSTQFQRCGIGSLYRIELSRRLIYRLTRHQCQCQPQQCQTLADKFSRHLMARTPEICIIDMTQLPFNESVVPIMRTIVDNRYLWPNLWRIDGCHIEHNRPTVHHTILPIQEMFRSLDVSLYTTRGPKSWIRQFRHLQHLTVRQIADVFDETFELVVENLKSFSCDQLSEQHVNRFKWFIDGNRGLKHLTIGGLTAVANNVVVEEVSVNQSLRQISRLKCLKSLSINVIQLLDESIGEPLTMIAYKCRQLIQFSLRFGYTKQTNGAAYVQTIGAIKRMHRLKRLEVITLGRVKKKDFIKASRQLTEDMKLELQLTDNCWPLMTRLAIGGKMMGLFAANQQFFNDIPRHMTRLKRLSVESRRKVIDGQLVLQSMVRLRCLETLIINGPVLSNLTVDQIEEILDQQERSTEWKYLKLAISRTIWSKIKCRFWSLMPGRGNRYQSIEVIEFDFQSDYNQ